MAAATAPDGAPDRVHGQAILSSGMGRELARALHREPDQRIPGHELKFDNQPLVANYLRVGYDPGRIVADLQAAAGFLSRRKIQVEDDITASVVLPRSALNDLDPEYDNPSVKLVSNCETLLFQRPDDAVHRGMDRQAEADIASPSTFLSNYEPLTYDQVQRAWSNTWWIRPLHGTDEAPAGGLRREPKRNYVVSSAHPRLVNGKPSQNPRYLQKRPDLARRAKAIWRKSPRAWSARFLPTRPVHFPVNAVLAGRRNSPPDPAMGIPPLAAFGPIHYQELPELFMEFISSLTGKSPATTGFGSEGALTKGPFNALWPVVDLNNALVSSILTGYAGFTTSAGVHRPEYPRGPRREPAGSRNLVPDARRNATRNI